MSAPREDAGIVLTVCLPQDDRETVETVFECSRLWVTGLKRSVNEMGPLSDFLGKAAEGTL
jgi:hypothetical protein